MKERPEAAHDPYWAADIGLFEGPFRSTRNEPVIVRARIHQATERYSADDIRVDIVPVAQQPGSRTYLHVQPYLLLPDIRLTVGVFPTPQTGGVLGEVVAAEETGTRRERIGTAQLWYYPADRVATIWEAYLSSAFREPVLAMDANMERLWLGIEDYLLTHFPGMKQITTPFRDPQFPDADYQAFLASLDYEPVAKAAW
jgi:hypothetical protein